MKYFNAQKAKQIVDNLKEENAELINILKEIKSEAEKGNSCIFMQVKTPLKKTIIEQLKDKGFKVINQQSTDPEIPGLYYSIHWDQIY